MSLEAFFKPPGPRFNPLVDSFLEFHRTNLDLTIQARAQPEELSLELSLDQLCPEAQRILDQPNAGGQSIRSEAYAMQILSNQRKAQQVFTEMEIDYFYDNWKKSDFVTTIHQENVGISVTRLLPRVDCSPENYDEYVSRLLYKKLFGLVVSRAGTLDKCAFSQSILLVWSPSRYLTQLIQATFHYCTDDTLKDDVELYVVESSEDLLRTDFRDATNITITIPPQLVK